MPLVRGWLDSLLTAVNPASATSPPLCLPFLLGKGSSPLAS